MSLPRSSRNQTLQSVLLVALLGIFIYPLIRDLQDSCARFFWFGLTGDESLHTEVVEVLANTGRYANQMGVRFVPQLTTGPTVIAAAAILKAITGLASVYAARAIAMGYFLALLAGVASLSAEGLAHIRSRPHLVCTVLFGIALFTQQWRTFQDTGYYRFGVFGEGAVAAFLLWAWILDQRSDKRSCLLGALLLGLAALSKPYVGLFVAIYAIIVTMQRQWMRLAAVLAPFILWLAWMVIDLGFSGTVEFWRLFPSVMRATNGGGVDTRFSLSHLAAKWGHARELLSVEGWIWLALGAALLASARVRLSRFWSTALIVHTAWWVVLSPGLQARYILPVVVIVFAANVKFGVQTYLRFSTWTLPRVQWPVGALVGGLLLLLGVKVGPAISHARESLEVCGTCRQVAVQEFWRTQRIHPMIFSTSSAGYAPDRDLFLSGPAEVHAFQPKVQDFTSGWISLGESASPESVAQVVGWIAENRCHEVFVLPLRRPYGLWQCRR